MGETSPSQQSQPVDQRAPSLPEAIRSPRELKGAVRFQVDPVSHNVLTGGIDSRTRAYLGIGNDAEVPAKMSLSETLPSSKVAEGFEVHYQQLADGKNGATTVIETETGKFIQITTEVLREDGGGPVYETVSVDVTETVQKERQRSQGVLQEAKALTRSALHEVKTPLTNIIGCADMILTSDHPLDYEQVMELVDIIRVNGDRMKNLAQEYLNYSQLGNGEKPELEPVSMKAVLFDLRHCLKVQAEQAKATITYPENMPVPLGVASYVEGVLINFLTNALKYGGECPAIEVAAVSLPDNKIRYEVRDRGPGIPADRIPELFKPFGRLKLPGQSRSDSNGLGLAIAKRQVEQMNGTIGVESEVGKGSTFYFVLDTAPETE